MATIGDVAKHAGVSTTLVSRYLNGVKGVSPASKEKIESAIRELQYVPDESARMLVRRRGGASAPVTPEEAAKNALPAAIALVCEDMDFQLTASLYLGAKHTVWNTEECRGYQILLFVIPAGDFRGPDEDETADYIRRTCKAVICAAETGSACCEKLTALSLPTVFLCAEEGGKPMNRSSADLKNACASLEERSAQLVNTLCEAVKNSETPTIRETVPFAFTVNDDRPQDGHNPVGRSLQSHLL